MDIPVVINGFSSRKITLRPRGFLSLAPKILLDGQAVPRRRFGYFIPDDAGKEVEFRLRYRFYDPVPDLMVAGERVELLPPFKVYEHAWICLPVLMVTFGGMLGGACGAVAVGVNYVVFRRVRHPVFKYLVAGQVTLCAVLLYFAFCLLLIHGFGIGKKS